MDLLRAEGSRLPACLLFLNLLQELRVAIIDTFLIDSNVKLVISVKLKEKKMSTLEPFHK